MLILISNIEAVIKTIATKVLSSSSSKVGEQIGHHHPPFLPPASTYWFCGPFDHRNWGPCWRKLAEPIVSSSKFSPLEGSTNITVSQSHRPLPTSLRPQLSSPLKTMNSREEIIKKKIPRVINNVIILLPSVVGEICREIWICGREVCFLDISRKIRGSNRQKHMKK